MKKLFLLAVFGLWVHIYFGPPGGGDRLQASVTSFAEMIHPANVEQSLDKIKTTVETVKTKQEQVTTAVEDISDKAEETADAFAALQKSLNEFRDALQSLVGGVKEAQDEILGEIEADSLVMN